MAGTAYVPYGISVLNQSGDLDGAARATRPEATRYSASCIFF